MSRFWNTFPIWMLQSFVDSNSTLVQVTTRYRQATSHYQSHCWPKYMSPYGVVVPQWVNVTFHDDVIKWKHFPRYWPFVRGIHRSPVYSPHKGQWRGVFMFSLICARINGWVNNCEAGDLRRNRAHYDVSVMLCGEFTCSWQCYTISIRLPESMH